MGSCLFTKWGGGGEEEERGKGRQGKERRGEERCCDPPMGRNTGLPFSLVTSIESSQSIIPGFD